MSRALNSNPSNDWRFLRSQMRSILNSLDSLSDRIGIVLRCPPYRSGVAVKSSNRQCLSSRTAHVPLAEGPFALIVRSVFLVL